MFWLFLNTMVSADVILIWFGAQENREIRVCWLFNSSTKSNSKKASPWNLCPRSQREHTKPPAFGRKSHLYITTTAPGDISYFQLQTSAITIIISSSTFSASNICHYHHHHQQQQYSNTRMRSFSTIIVIFFIWFIVISCSVYVDASRPLSDSHVSSSWMKGFTVVAKAYSGPSKGGKGHWTALQNSLSSARTCSWAAMTIHTV